MAPTVVNAARRHDGAERVALHAGDGEPGILEDRRGLDDVAPGHVGYGDQLGALRHEDAHRLATRHLGAGGGLRADDLAGGDRVAERLARLALELHLAEGSAHLVERLALARRDDARLRALGHDHRDGGAGLGLGGRGVDEPDDPAVLDVLVEARHRVGGHEAGLFQTDAGLVEREPGEVRRDRAQLLAERDRQPDRLALAQGLARRRVLGQHGARLAAVLAALERLDLPAVLLDHRLGGGELQVDERGHVVARHEHRAPEEDTADGEGGDDEERHEHRRPAPAPAALRFVVADGDVVGPVLVEDGGRARDRRQVDRGGVVAAGRGRRPGQQRRVEVGLGCRRRGGGARERQRRGRGSSSAAAMKATASSPASGRSSGWGWPARARERRSGPSSSGTSTGLSTRAISVAMVVSAANGTRPVTASTSTSDSA
jgi:hypothetical protein